MTTTLVVFTLTKQTSYQHDESADATPSRFDTVQFLATPTGGWRIRTFAMDEDVHTWSLGADRERVLAMAHANTHRHYDDIIDRVIDVDSESGIDALRAGLRAKGLDDHLEEGENGMAFWAPAGTTYRTRSTPK